MIISQSSHSLRREAPGTLSQGSSSGNMANRQVTIELKSGLLWRIMNFILGCFTNWFKPETNNVNSIEEILDANATRPNKMEALVKLWKNKQLPTNVWQTFVEAVEKVGLYDGHSWWKWRECEQAQNIYNMERERQLQETDFGDTAPQGTLLPFVAFQIVPSAF